MAMELSEIRKHVTHYSLELKLKAVQEEEVVVGGRVTTIVPPVDDEYPMHIVMLDDLVGITHVLVPDNLMDEYKDSFSYGNYVFVEGFVNFVSHQQKKEMKKDVSVFAFGVKTHF